ncbi:MAG: hypothetical protein GY812_13285 [Actinomycetia bacterium]|nr:hypothetical protein [Actinomycetes bacterium]
MWLTGGILPIGRWSEDDWNLFESDTDTEELFETPLDELNTDPADGECDFDRFLQDPDC